MHRYRCWNGAMPTTSVLANVATGTSLKTMLQIATPSTRQIQLISWGYDLSVAPGAAGAIELVETDVAATVTAHVAAGVQPVVTGLPASLVTLGTSATGYTATAEGTPTASRVFDEIQVPAAAGNPALHYRWQWMPDERPVVAVSKFLRVRVLLPTSGANMTCFVVWDE